MSNLEEFTYLVTTANGSTYNYTGTVEGLKRHLAANEHLGVTATEANRD